MGQAFGEEVEAPRLEIKICLGVEAQTEEEEGLLGAAALQEEAHRLCGLARAYQ